MTTELQQAAIEYVGAGLRILALTQKKPNGRVHGDQWSWEDSFWTAEPLTDTDRTAIEQAFDEATGTTGIAILIPPDFYVADVDSERAAVLLTSLGFAPSDGTVAAKTKNGLHIWFWEPGANRNRWLGDGEQPDPGRTLLFKGLGGYVVAPPSLHFDAAGAVDGSYVWAMPLVSGSSIFMPDTLPPAVRQRFAAEDQFAATAPPKEPMASFRLEPVEGKPWWQWPKVWSYGMEGLEHAIETAADGNQNNVIHWAALTAREEGVPYEVAMERLLAAAIRGNHPRNRARDTIRGAYKRPTRE
jgi:hypothetical protein